MHISFGIDSKYVFPVGVCITSVLERNSNIVFHIFTDKITEDDSIRLKNTMEKWGSKTYIYFVDTKKLCDLRQTEQWSIATYFRFIIFAFLSNKLNRILYLDADTMCLGNLSNMYHIDFGDTYIAAVDDIISPPSEKTRRKSKLGVKGKLFNAGVLLVDLKKWNINNFTSKAFVLLRTCHEKWEFLDQDVLNVLLDGHITYLPRKYNVFGESTFQLDRNQTIILHFIGSEKPWKVYSICQYNYLYDEIFLKIKEKSAWKDVPLWQPQTPFQCRMMARKARMNKEYLKVILWQYRYLYRKIVNIFINK